MAETGGRNSHSGARQPGQEDQPDLTDDRPDGDFRTRYPLQCWIQICIELVYLIVILLTCLLGLLVAADSYSPTQPGIFIIGYNSTVSNDVARWLALSIAGMIGGAVFDLKWLYHSVAWKKWNHDRIIWRLIVPLNSAAVSLFFGLLLSSGLVPFVMRDTFENMFAILGGGFVFGYFSDSILAALQNFARRLFGTLDS
jgi:hypothetical protein